MLTSGSLFMVLKNVRQKVGDTNRDYFDH